MEENPQPMCQRGALVEHPFGTLKHRAGIHHFLMRGLKKCRGEFSLGVRLQLNPGTQYSGL
jgi:hypothetical protein